MYSRIQEVKGQGFSKRKASRLIRVSRGTIDKYWDMEPDDYAARYMTVNRMTALSAYETIIVKWLEAYPCMTAAQVRDWLDEKYHLDAAERTVRRFVAKIREQYGITRKEEPRREYEAVEELPIGHQMQLDFGEKTARHAYSSRYIKLYFVVCTLSWSRYKWGHFQEQPFTSEDLVQALYGCFDYFGGIPRQLVYDQDSILVVSENSGDIIHTKAFAAFLAESKLKVRVCRKSDPETKGLVESSVKFIKGNFMANRLFMDIDIWNGSFEEWLIRTGNGKKHGTTKRKPAEMFAEEQVHLLPLFGIAPARIEEEMDRTVRADNTILYLSNRYSLPLGTYGKLKTVYLSVEGSALQIMNQVGDTLATHQISGEKGKLVKSDSHRRDKASRIRELRDRTVALLGEEFREHLTVMCEEKPRYVKEQLDLVVRVCEGYGREHVLAAMQYCQGLALYSANDLSDAVQSMYGNPSLPPQPQRLPVEDERYHIPVQKRPLSAYTEATAGSGVAR
ncbi:MAG: IS21 family transposase [Peptococcaceae bacterium]|nr:IS21 family transposase [Peptococcaceae bacterium]